MSLDDISCSTPKNKTKEPEKLNGLLLRIVINTQALCQREPLANSSDIACETWPKPDIYDSEGILADLGYEIFHKDRKDSYGEVLIAVK